MKKILATTLLFFGIQSALFGQGAAVELGPKVKGMKRASSVEIIGKDEEAIYVNQIYYSFLSLKYVREVYNLNMEKTNSVQYDPKKTNNRVVKKILGTILLKDKMFSLFSNTDLNNKINTLEIDEINKSTLLPEGNEKTLAEISFEEGNKRNTGGFSYTQSQDSSKVLVYYYLPYVKGQPQKFGMHVYNDEFEEIWNKEIELPYDDELFDIVSYRVGNDGNVYVLGKVYEEKHRDKKRGEVNYKYHVFYYTKNENDTYDMPIESKSKFFNEISMSLNNNNQVICVGLYTTSLGGVSEGTFYMRIDSKTHKVVADTQKEFSELMDDNNNDSERKRKRKQDRVYRNYDFRQIIQKEDGGIIVVAEQYYVVVVTSTSTSSTGTSTKTTYYYHYDNILVLNIDKNGKFIWQKIIPKNQVSANDGGYYSSYTLAVKEDKLYFLYNTPITKFLIFSYPTNVLSLFVLDEDGELSDQSDIINKKDSKVSMVPKTGVQVSDNEILMFGRGKRMNRFSRITLD